MPKNIDGFDRHWTLKQVTQFLDDAEFMHSELSNLWDEIDAEIDFMEWERKVSDYGQELADIQEELGHICGQVEDLTYMLRDFRKTLKDSTI